jgi:hypothetical protein
MAFNPLALLLQGQQTGFDTRLDPSQVSSRTGRTLDEDLRLAQAGGNPYGDIEQGELGSQPTLGHGTDGQTFRMARPNWAPGEFEEWKNAHITGMPTTFGWNAQQRYKAGRLPGGNFADSLTMHPLAALMAQGKR